MDKKSASEKERLPKGFSSVPNWKKERVQTRETKRQLTHVKRNEILAIAP
jgi:hypothetical protein